MKRRKMFGLALVSLILHNSMRSHVSQCFHCVKTDNGYKTRFSAFNHILLKNAFKRRKTLDSALVILILHNLMRLHVSQCVHCVKTDNVNKTPFWREITHFSAYNVVFAEKRVYTQGNACFGPS